MTQRRSVLAVSLAVVAVLVFDGIVVVHRRSSSPASLLEQRLRALDRIAPKPDPALLASIDTATREVEAFVSATRGLRFTRSVPVRVLNDVEFNSLLGADARPNPSQRRQAEENLDVFSGLKFVTGHPDLYRLTQSRIEDIAGIYSGPLQELFLRGEAVTPALRVTLAHELTHALDDQHFGLRGRPRVDDHAYAYAALVEGDAVVVANRYLASRPPAEQQAIGTIDLARLPAVRTATAAIPPTLLRIIQFPYGAGPSFVNALITAGGEARLDAAFHHPPQTTAEILDPTRYLYPFPHRANATAPPAGGTVFQRGSLGAFRLLLLLQQVLPPTQARPAATRWGDDAYVAWRDHGLTCVRDRVVSLDAATGGLLEAALQRWASADAATVDQQRGPEGSLTFTMCN